MIDVVKRAKGLFNVMKVKAEFDENLLAASDSVNRVENRLFCSINLSNRVLSIKFTNHLLSKIYVRRPKI